ncbi:MAG: type II toxin-antitoxin system prevent-host-death family antitoxin [Candidatus Margulisbacteria bacterium]|jgi:prevent-host-death family protein|nr:type II toxin-antitoxin system prevent-host-death family antitoxin [Candidatus Margulisiibacteriota bacterium]
MQSIGAFEAKTHFSQILDDVQSGQDYIVTKRGKPVAKIIPLADKAPNRQETVKELFAIGRNARKPYSVRDLLADIRAGRP